MSGHLKSIFLINLILVTCILNVGCSKKEQPKDSAKLLYSALPETTSSFYLLDGSKFKDNPLTINDLIDLISNIETSDSSKIESIKDNILKILAALPQGRFAEYISGLVTYVSDTEMGLCVQATGTQSASILYSNISKLHDQNNFAIQSNENSDRLLVKFNVSPTNNILSSMSSSDCLTKNKSKYKLDTNLSEQLINPLTFAIGSFNIQKDLEIPSESGSISSNDLPVNSFQIIQSLDKTYRLQLLAPLSPKSPEQTRLVEVLDRSSSSQTVPSSFFSGVTDQASFALNLSNTFINAILDAVIAQSPTDQVDIAKSLKPLLEYIDNVSLSVLQAGGESLFPDIVLSFSSKNSSKLHELLKNEIQKLVSSQVPMSNWFEKETSGIRLNYVQSPLGVGVYITNDANNVFVSSSESGVINVTDSKAIQLDNELATRGYNFPKSSSLFSAYASAPRIAALIESVQSSLSLFTGGQSTFNNEQLGLLRSMSIGTLSVYSRNKVLNVEFDFLPKATAQKP
jgi:hypothetical protein